MQILISRTKKEIKRDINKVERDLRALEILHEDNLLPKDYYIESKTQLNESLNLLKEEKGMSYHEIGLLLGRDERNIWTVYNRSKKK